MDVLPRLWKWQTTLELVWYSVVLTVLTSVAWSMALVSTVFRPIWSCQIIKVLTTSAKFLELSVCSTMISCTFTFCINVFGCFCGVMIQFKFVKHIFLDWIIHSCVWFSNPTLWGNVLVHQLLQYYQPKWVLSTIWTTLVIWHICCKLALTKYCKTFDLP